MNHRKRQRVRRVHSHLQTTCGVTVILVLLMGPLGIWADEPIDFAHDIVPILQTHCAKCHSNGTYKGGFSIDNQASLLKSGSVQVGASDQSELMSRVTSDDADYRMPSGGQLSPDEIRRLQIWIDQGLAWEPGFSFRAQAYLSHLEPRSPELPPVVEGRDHPIDRLVDAYFAEHGLARPELSDDATFLRRVSLDLLGVLPEVNTLRSFLAEEGVAKRSRMIDILLGDSIGYADHWLTFWNDLLRNDFQGTGYIDGGREQITTWLYESLVQNKPYDQFVRELIDPTDASAGFIKGIQWRGRVNASQVYQLQFAQNISQVMLGINMKCASCHDSFINDWKLKDAYGLAAIISDEPLEIHRCDNPTGEIAEAKFVFPELGTIDPALPKQERLAQLSRLISSPQNGRFARTIVNRLWDRMMGRGLVHPVDIMSNPAWSEDLLDFLASELVSHDYDLKHVLQTIATSEIYQAKTVPVQQDEVEDDYRFRGPVAKRMTAEQFQDAVWSICGNRPSAVEGKVGFRGNREVRAALVSADLLMRSLGRPNREQVVTTRPAELTTLQALDLTNGDGLAEQLAKGSHSWLAMAKSNVSQVVSELYLHAVSRPANESEIRAASELLGEVGEHVSEEGMADLLWVVLMLPEFQAVR